MQFTSILALGAALLGAVHGSTIPQNEIRDVNVTPNEIHAFWKGDVAWFGEKADAHNHASEAEKRACTRCVGHHGLCTIGEGNCYAPDGCYFCGGCGADRARCQDPNGECQCY